MLIYGIYRYLLIWKGHIYGRFKLIVTGKIDGKKDTFGDNFAMALGEVKENRVIVLQNCFDSQETKCDKSKITANFR